MTTFLKLQRSAAVVFVCLFALQMRASGAEKIGDEVDGSRSPSVHVIDLYDKEGMKIRPDNDIVLPMSNEQTCSQCHDVEKISKGWHFNWKDPSVDPGRVGQAWILADPETGTQIPLSYRDWPGTYNPDEIGVTMWQFAKLFGRHSPGPMKEDLEGEIDFDARWMVSGELEVNCLACHDNEPGHDQSNYAMEVMRENFHWAAASTLAFTTVKGAAKDMSATYDFLFPEPPLDPKLIEPSISYDEDRFREDGKVFLDVSTEIKNENCYFCHSNFDVHEDMPEKWMHDQDVHLMAGLSCVDCHRNGLGHNIVRGYEGEAEHSDNPLAASSSCEGCHLPSEGEKPKAGRFAAPEPEHAGIPTVHFRELTCTACHSGPWPEDDAYLAMTARANGLGMHGIDKTPGVLPHLYSPVFKENPDGKIGPYKVVYPNFWAYIDGENATPLVPEKVKPIIGEAIAGAKPEQRGSWHQFTDEQVAKALKLLADTTPEGSAAGYVSGGKVFALDKDGELVVEEHGAAKPYGWPIAHNVRPAEQSLGVRGCGDCHETDSPIVFGDIPADTPMVSQQGEAMEMASLQGVDRTHMKLFAMSFVFRPMLKVVTILCSAVIAAVVLFYVLKAFGFVTVKASDDESAI
ncbi:hypothetical protein STSP2_02462 [Anaerohalosphaera lusitana]|uniref:Uncharacterized protein n=1 Tax=Anaerohalosphaera lusitana TaxID=1936003 RepID=A0A1U9NMY5_9BACT|nr:multiheme c-type cytochrome [Anaerohalosphaera lusitana]AQT69273.1 hypothetical protein STSP2_02462 [Anaerohalosphaera lusitana]